MTKTARILLAACWAATTALVPDVEAATSSRRPIAASRRGDQAPRCGNGKVEPGETCDDGNTDDGDVCPATCRIERCMPTAARFDVAVELVVAVGGVVVFVRYPEGRVSLPGSGAERTVAARTSNLPKDFASAPYDLDYALREIVVMVRPMPPGELFRVHFDLCDGASPPAAGDFTCRVEQASGPGGKKLDLAGFACVVKALGEGAR